MALSFNADPVVESVNRVARGAYDQGFADGYAAAVTKMMETARGMATDSIVEQISAESPAAIQRAAENRSVARRAPKGAVDTALETVLAERPGQTDAEVEKSVVERDPRVSPKSVYNKLRSWEQQGKRFRRKDGRWYRIADLPSGLPVFRDGRLFQPNEQEAPV